jgi:Abnormal spindle-like microcephaly-assoc'd, ASPM-SPD-2-Hydin
MQRVFLSALQRAAVIRFRLDFNPTVATDYSAETVVADSAAKPLAQVAIHGRGRKSTQLIAQMSVSASRLDFGSVTVGSSTIQALTLTSAGTSPVTISSATIGGTGFSLVGGSLPATLNPNQSLTLQVQFSSTATGATSAQLTISSDSATNNTTTVLLSGSGEVTQLPQLTLSTGALSFGSVTVNTSTTQTVTLTSTGTSPVTISSATIGGTGFSLVGGSLPATLNPNQSLTLQIQFKPTITGAANGQLAISSNSSSGRRRWWLSVARVRQHRTRS